VVHIPPGPESAPPKRGESQREEDSEDEGDDEDEDEMMSEEPEAEVCRIIYIVVGTVITDWRNTRYTTRLP
jgi:hypothetical protein